MTVTTKGYPTVRHKTPRIWPSVIAAILLLIAAAAPARAQSYTIMPSPFQAPLNDTGSLIVGGCVWTYAAGTTTPISTYTNTSGTTSSNPIIVDSTGRFTAYLLAGTTYKFVYETACTPPAHGAALRTADNIAGTPAAAATVDFTCTAGETISAGLAVYLSDGSGAKTLGSCYKADSANTYSSSTAAVVGLAPATITIGNSGTVRTAGSVTGLSSLTVGGLYYIGTAGAITITPPTNARLVAQADTATTVVVGNSRPAALTAGTGVTLTGTGSAVTITAAPVNLGLACGRLTLTTATPITTADVTAATTVFYTPTNSCNQVTLWNGTAAVTDTLTETSVAVPATTSQMYDVFAFDNSGAVNIEVLAWTNDTTRATAVTLQNGFLCKAATPARRYVGSFRTTTVSGQTEDSAAKRYVWNYYNRVPRFMQVLEATANWAYSTATWRQARATAANQLAFVIGIAEVTLDARVTASASNTGAGNADLVGIGLDSTTTPATGMVNSNSADQVANTPLGSWATLYTMPAVGFHFAAWLEYVTGGTGTYQGVTGAALPQSGISGVIQG